MPKGARKAGTISSTAKWLIGLLIPVVGGLVTLLVSHSLSVADDLRHARETEAYLTQFAPTFSQTASLSPSATASPTITPSPTYTFTSTFTQTATLTPTEQINGLEFCVTVGSVNVRSGPGMEYALSHAALSLAECLYFDGSNADGTWLRITTGQADFSGVDNWVNASFLTRDDDQKPPVVPVPPTPYPTFTPAG